MSYLKQFIVVLLAIPVILMADVECLKISGDFSESIKIWQDRWYACSGSTVQVSSSQVAAVCGLYKKDKIIHRFQSWAQINGPNILWFGDRCNPYNSFDAWYVGDPSCIAVPARTMSIPRLPTFIPNELSLGARNFDPTDRTRKAGTPVAEKVVLSDLEFAALSQNGYTIQGPVVALAISGIVIENGNVKIWWVPQLNRTYGVSASDDLFNWHVVEVNIQATFPYTYFREPANKTNQFYKIQMDK